MVHTTSFGGTSPVVRLQNAVRSAMGYMIEQVYALCTEVGRQMGEGERPAETRGGAVGRTMYLLPLAVAPITSCSITSCSRKQDVPRFQRPSHATGAFLRPFIFLIGHFLPPKLFFLCAPISLPANSRRYVLIPTASQVGGNARSPNSILVTYL